MKPKRVKKAFDDHARLGDAWENVMQISVPNRTDIGIRRNYNSCNLCVKEPSLSGLRAIGKRPATLFN